MDTFHAQRRWSIGQEGQKYRFFQSSAKAALDEALAQVEQTKAEITARTIRALVDGQVLQMNVRPGE